MNGLKLYHYWRSSASWRVRGILEFKGLKAEFIHVNIVNGDNEKPEHLARQPLGYVPVLETQGKYLIESVAIFEFLEEKYPERPLLPRSHTDRAHVRSLIEIINAGIQPIQNLSVTEMYSEDPEKVLKWNQHFVLRGLQAYEKLAAPHSGKFSFGDSFTGADFFLVPQVYNALRFNLDIEKEFPKLTKIYNLCIEQDPIKKSHPDLFKP